jgi:hypothetical protein
MSHIRFPYVIAALLALSCGGDRSRLKPPSDTSRAAESEEPARGRSGGSPPSDSLNEAVPSSESPPPPSEVVFRVPMDVALTISNSERYAGTYRSSGVGRVCGRNPYQLPGLEKSWVVEFSNDSEPPIHDLRVTARRVEPGASTREYGLSATVVKRSGVSPSFALRLGDAGGGAQTGTMSLREEGYTARIEVEGRTARGEQVDVTITCKRGESREGS